MKFREHRYSRADSFTTQVEVADFNALLAHLRKLAEPWPTMPPINESTVRVVDYLDGQRIVILNGYGPMGFVWDEERK